MSFDNIAAPKLPSYVTSTVAFLAIALFALGFMAMWPASLLTGDTIILMVVVVGSLVILYVGLAVCRATVADTDSTILRLSLLIWFVLLFAEGLFDRQGDEVDTYKGLITDQAYGEAIVWVVAAAILFVILVPHLSYLRFLFSNYYKWATIYFLVCFGSIAYTPDKSYSLAWCFKLGLVVTLLAVCIPTVSSVAKAILFLRISLWGALVFTLIPILIAMSDPEGVFSGAGGRVVDPTLVSQKGAFILLLAMLLYALQKKKQALVFGAIGAAVMVLAFGKTSIVAGGLSAALMSVMQGRRKTALWVVVGLIVLTVIIFLTVPQVSQYASSYQGTDTLSGRTAVWEMALPRIKQRPIQGYGYLASHFIWLSERGHAAEFAHLHNSFLDVTYNLGLLGLIPMLMMHYGIVKNLRNALRRTKASPSLTDSEERKPSRTLYLLTAGILALYVNLLINGMLTTVFGGRATFLFMSFLAVLALSEIVNRESLSLGTGRDHSFSRPGRRMRETYPLRVYVPSDQRV
jgi:O-antigen ligase